MSKVLVMRGIPGSGKTTFAKKLVADQPNWFRVNRDDERAMFDGDMPYNYKRERYVMAAHKAIVRALLAAGVNVVVDDTNLTDSHLARWRTIADEFNAGYAVHVMETSLKECIGRNSMRSRDHFVPISVLINMARGIKMPDAFGEKEVICDVDGTIAEISHRLKYMTGPEKNWNKAFSLIPQDSVRQEILDQLNQDINDGCHIVMVSARSESNREATENWFRANRIPFTTLLMRNNGDFRDDVEVKRDILNKFFIRDRIVKVYDDRLRVIQMWEEEGFNVVNCNVGGEY